MIWTTTGNLSNIRNNAKMPFGVAMLPQGVRRGTPTGGGNFHLFAAASPAQRTAALQFLRWVTTPERAAQWGIDTGYVAVRPDAWETPRMKAHVAGFPEAAVARDQLQFAVPELSTHDKPARDPGAEHGAGGGADRPQAGRPGPGGGAGHGHAAAAVVPVVERGRAGMPGRPEALQGWLLVLPGGRAAGGLHACPGGRDAAGEPVQHAAGRPGGALRGARSVSRHG